MFSSGPTVRRLVASVVTCAVVATTLLVPFLDRYAGEGRAIGPGDPAPVVAVGHDHSICVQVSATLGILPSAVLGPEHGREVVEAGPRTPVRAADRDASRHHLSRAPPVI